MKNNLKLFFSRGLLLMAVSLSMTGCHYIGTKTVDEEGGSVGKNFTYAWMQQPTSSLERMSNWQRKNIKNGFAKAASERGAVEVPAEVAEYLVAVHYSSSSDIGVVEVNDDYGSQVHRSSVSDDNQLLTTSIPKGELVIDLIDSGSYEIVWRGSTRFGANPFQMNVSAYSVASQIPGSGSCPLASTIN